MALNVQCKHCANYRHEWCKEVTDSPDPDMVRDCAHFWELTNFRMIQQMTEDDFQDWFCQGEHDCDWCRFSQTGKCEIETWLKSEVDT